MTSSWKFLLRLAALAWAIGIPEIATAQVAKVIKEHAAKKVEQHKAAADSTIIHATDKAVDSTLVKSSRAVDTVVGFGGKIIDTSLNRVESAASTVGNKLTGGGAAAKPFAADLAAGHAVIRTIEFAPNSDQPTAAAEGVLRQLASALGTVPGTFLIEVDADPSGDAAADLALTQRRATAVKSRLTAGGIPETRLFTVGYGSTHPAASTAPTSNARIELTKIQ